jgi:hypothetical protein
MIRRAVFQLRDNVDTQVLNQLSNTTIYLYLALRQKRSLEPRSYPSSGFPRCLVVEDSFATTRLANRAGLIRQRRYSASALDQVKADTLIAVDIVRDLRSSARIDEGSEVVVLDASKTSISDLTDRSTSRGSTTLLDVDPTVLLSNADKLIQGAAASS